MVEVSHPGPFSLPGTLPAQWTLTLSAGNGYKYAGIEYYGECFCGQTINGAELPNSDCTYACSGNQSEICGGYQKLSVYRDPTFVNNGSDVTDDDYKYLGCYSDDSSLGRTLSWQMNIDSTNLTTEACLTACRQANYPFAGTEYGGKFPETSQTSSVGSPTLQGTRV